MKPVIKEFIPAIKVVLAIGLFTEFENKNSVKTDWPKKLG
jgi:hypothetical protein